MASTSLTWTPSSAGSQQKTTLSMWLKKSKPDNAGYIFEVSDGSNQFVIRESNAQIKFWHFAGSSYDWEAEITPLLRDTNGWYNFVMSIDTTQSTLANRLKCWLNGVSQTVTFTSGSSNLSQNSNWIFNKNSTHRWGRADNSYWDGLMSHIIQTDGYCYDASTFGLTDSTTGEWSINGNPTIANYGTNGYWILKDGNSVTDQSPNTNNFTVATGTLTKSEDNPSNLFATLNPLFYSADVTLSNGNTTVVESSNNWRSAYSQIGLRTGKWYWEAQISYQSGNEAYFGIAHEDHINGYDVTYGSNSQTAAPNRGGYDYLGYSTKSFGIYSNGNQDYPSSTTYTGAYNASTYVMSFALDLPNRKLYVARNGVWTNGSNNDWGSSTFDSTVGAIDISGKIPTTGFVFPGFSPNESTWKVNFGNGYFGTTAISSPQQDDAGFGNFQYDPPTGYYAICTKNINTYG